MRRIGMRLRNGLRFDGPYPVCLFYTLGAGGLTAAGRRDDAGGGQRQQRRRRGGLFGVLYHFIIIINFERIAVLRLTAGCR